MTYEQLSAAQSANITFYNESYGIKLIDGEIHYDTEYLYLFYNPITGLTKIGIANNLDRRLMQLGTACGTRLVSMLFVELWRYKDTTAFSVERILHRVLKHKRVVGEWFSLNKRDLAIIRRFFYEDIGGEDIGGRATVLRTPYVLDSMTRKEKRLYQ